LAALLTFSSKLGELRYCLGWYSGLSMQMASA